MHPRYIWYNCFSFHSTLISIDDLWSFWYINKKNWILTEIALTLMRTQWASGGLFELRTYIFLIFYLAFRYFFFVVEPFEYHFRTVNPVLCSIISARVITWTKVYANFASTNKFFLIFWRFFWFVYVVRNQKPGHSLTLGTLYHFA